MTPVAPRDRAGSAGASPGDVWRAVLEGDKQAFRALAEPHLDELIAAARHEVAYHVDLGDLPRDALTAHELVGDTLIAAWQRRYRRPTSLGFREWLLGTQLRVLDGVVRRHGVEERLAMQSLDAPYDDIESLTQANEDFWEWPGPAEALLWEDVVGEAESAPGPDLTDAARRRLESLARRAVVLHERHGLSADEVAQALHLPLAAGSALLEWATERADDEEEPD